jgi:flagellar operon protein
MSAISENGAVAGLQVGSDSSRQRAVVRRAPAEQQLTFSRHLADRLNRRHLSLSGERINRLTRAVERVAGRGGQDSVVFLDELALLVNVPSRTVVTAIETQSMKEGVFTNIDSVVVG